VRPSYLVDDLLSMDEIHEVRGLGTSIEIYY
jgi:hypothetical protein